MIGWQIDRHYPLCRDVTVNKRAPRTVNRIQTSSLPSCVLCVGGFMNAHSAIHYIIFISSIIVIIICSD